jgi:hypothetical protein
MIFEVVDSQPLTEYQYVSIDRVAYTVPAGKTTPLRKSQRIHITAYNKGCTTVTLWSSLRLRIWNK